MSKFFKRSLTVFLVFSMLLSIICVGNAQEVVQYFPDSKFTLSSQTINYIIGRNQKFSFKKPDKNSDNPLEYELFPEGSPKPDDVIQGNLGICYLLSALSSIVDKHPEIIKNAIKDNEDGTVTVKVYDLRTAQPQYIKVDKTIPDLPKQCAFLNKECLWVEVLIKALMAINLEQRACAKFWPDMKYESLEGGFAAPVLKMITGKECCKYNDLGLFKRSSKQVYALIKDTLENGSGIITCDFNHNRFEVILRSMLRLPASEKGLVYSHEYSVVDAFEDESKEKWIVVRNPWGTFGSTYDKNGLCLKTDDEKSDGYCSIKLKDFYQCCGSLKIVTQDTLRPMTVRQEFREFTYTSPFILASSLIPYAILRNITDKTINADELSVESKLGLYYLSMNITQLIFW